MLRRDPTRIELRTEDLADFERAREEYLEISAKARARDPRKTFKAETTEPPPTPINQDLHNTATGAGSSSGSTSKEPRQDPFELAQQERKGKSTMERVLGEPHP
ncbi:hypothetical protein B0O80DRAFT_444521 [Mortierella sp. GBAus27b]|nr:hypothetical protein BGX31_007916 [Mortierella sp. GBA43]KAI8358336.1 hypothetical protein B0O80DRAFT_444521 [Mortierella sp. GBAus27b]